jgi:hypothetical protein
LRRVSDARQELDGQFEPLGRIADRLEPPHSYGRNVTGEDVYLVLGIDAAEIGQERGLPRQGPLELTREQGLVQALAER